MLPRFTSVAANTFLAMVRQPIYALLLLLGAALIGLSPLFAMFTYLENIRLVKDMGLSTILVTGLLLAAFSATNVISEEIENRTVLTLLAKPLARWQFIVGKFLGMSAGILLATYLLGVVLLLTVRIGVPETVTSPIDYLALSVLLGAVGVSVIVAAGINYFFDRAATSAGVALATVLLTLGLVPMCTFDMHLNLRPVFSTIDTQVVAAVVLIAAALLVICSAALAVSTRWGLVPNVGFCSILFFMGLMSDYLFGRFAAESLPARFAYRLLPNLQIFWVADAVSSGSGVPGRYALTAVGYGLAYTLGFVLIAIGLFQGREIS
jgi:ABC-type transport system involved in multi-copper enzyme maturation permease subunit